MFPSMLKAATGSVATAVALNLAFAPALAAPIDPVQANVAKYVIPLVIPPQMPKSGRRVSMDLRHFLFGI